MGVRPHQTNTAHFTECSEGLLDTLQNESQKHPEPQMNSSSISVTDERLYGVRKTLDHQPACCFIYRQETFFISSKQKWDNDLTLGQN